MNDPTVDFDAVGKAKSSPEDSGADRLGLVAMLGLSAWCGLVAGLLEVGTFVLRKHMFDPNQLYGVSRHFVWLIPVANLCAFLAIGLAGCGAVLACPRRGRPLFARLLFAVTLLPMVVVAYPRIYTIAWFLVTLGVAARIVPAIERNAAGFRRFVRVSFPVAVGTVVILGTSIWAGDRIRQSRASTGPCRRRGHRTSCWSCWTPWRRDI